MSKENIFEVALRNKFRFNYKGSITTEQLFELKVEELDIIYKSLNSELKKFEEESLLNTKTKANEEIEVKIDIIKYIVSLKLTEQNERLKAKENKEKKQQLMAILESKRKEALQNKSEEEILAMLAELD